MAIDRLVDSADLTSIVNAIRSKGGTSALLTFPQDFVDAIENIETDSADPSKPVKFIDYDGTLLYSYTVAELQALTELPANPSHSGLTSQGWNWTLAQAKTQLTAMPDAGLTIGQMYITDDGKTRIYCHFETGRLAPYLGIGVNGTMTVDWGDGSSTDTLTGTSLTTVTTVQHTYSTVGDYIITLTVESGSFSFFGVTNGAHILKKSTANTANISRVYANTVQRIEMGDSATIGNYAFYYCSSLTSITIPNSVTSIGNNAFSYCYNLTSITIPNNVTSISGNAFSVCESLVSISIPSGMVSIDGNAFQSCDSLASITIPNNVTSIGNNAFSGCDSLTSISIPGGVTNMGGGVFGYCYSLASITMPNDITSIGMYTLNSCYSLTSITIPEGVTSIGVNAFQNCYGLGEMHFLPTTPPTVSASNVFQNIQTDCKIYVPSGSLAAYTSATNYPSSSTYTYIEE